MLEPTVELRTEICNAYFPEISVIVAEEILGHEGAPMSFYMGGLYYETRLAAYFKYGFGSDYMEIVPTESREDLDSDLFEKLNRYIDEKGTSFQLEMPFLLGLWQRE